MKTQTAPQPLALLYVRVSTDRQAKSGHSLESQPAALTALAEAQGYRVEVITETGSGRRAARPALGTALDRLKSGEASALYALDIDRLARSTTHLLSIAEKATKQGWRLVIKDSEVDTSTPTGKAFLTIAAAFAEYESDMTSMRVKRQHEARRARGEVWGVTQGFKSPLPADTIALIVALSDSGLSRRAIASQLNEAGVPTAKGGAWIHTSVGRVLNSPARSIAA